MSEKLNADAPATKGDIAALRELLTGHDLLALGKPLLNKAEAERFAGIKCKAFASFAKAHKIKPRDDGYFRRVDLDRAIRDEPRKGNSILKREARA